MSIAKGLIVVSLVAAAQLSSARVFAFPALPHKGVAQLSAGTLNTCALLADRHVSCWGSFPVAFSETPSPVRNIGTAVSVSVGEQFACALLLDQTVWCWGVNGNGELGDGTFNDRDYDPAPVGTSGNPLTGVIAIAAGDSHACALKFNYTVFCWGSNSDGQLGNWNLGIGAKFNTPIEVVIHDGMTNPALDSVTSISAGALHTCAVVAGVTAACWGQERLGRLGDGTPSNVNNPIDSPVGVLAPGSSDNLGLSGDNIISAGTLDSCALLPEDAPANNSIACWGDNGAGQTGNPYELGFYTSKPAPVVDTDGNKLENLSKVAVGDKFACALLRKDGSIECWGNNYLGKLGNNRFASASGYSVVPVAVAVDGNTLTGFEDMVTGMDHACGLTGQNTVLCWGSNEGGQLGIGTYDLEAHPAPVNSEVDAPIFTDNFDGN